jgi:cytidylate kinase
MSQQQNKATEMRVITISRQYGSGGGEIATRLAQRLRWQLIDHEIVAQVAHTLGITEEEAEVHDEHVEGFIARALNALQVAMPVMPVQPTTTVQDEQIFHEALLQVVETAAQMGHVVIVGRTSQAILANRRDVLHLRMVAPLDRRIAYVARREGLDEEAARARIQLKDRDRTRYLQSQFNRDVNDPMLYDLIINTGVIDLESAVDLALLAFERKGAMLKVSTQELGPAAGMAAYPGHPADLRPPDSMVGQ